MSRVSSNENEKLYKQKCVLYRQKCDNTKNVSSIIKMKSEK